MNERIKELAEQAGLKVELWMTNPPKAFQILGSTEQFEKFTELLIQKCMSLTERCMDDDTIFALNGAEIIAEHFGVEE